ncbi:Uroporphyrinogen-III synthase [Fusarium oxysporum f. sp. albedinis]|nr:Uroporphyrinogen-III synthase [Fusarium oxysporum f. sp. albedinis]
MEEVDSSLLVINPIISTKETINAQFHEQPVALSLSYNSLDVEKEVWVHMQNMDTTSCSVGTTQYSELQMKSKAELWQQQLTTSQLSPEAGTTDGGEVLVG